MSNERADVRHLEIIRILADSDPQEALFTCVRCHHQTDPERAVAVFEGVMAARVVDHYWTLYQIAQAYRSIGNFPTAFTIAVRAEALEPDERSWHLYEIIYHYHMSQGQVAKAAEALLRQLEKAPEDSGIVDIREVKAVFAEAGIKIPGLPELLVVAESNAQIRISVVAESSNLVMPAPRQFGPKPLALSFVHETMQRDEVRVWEMVNARVVIQDGSTLVFDSDGVLHPQFSRSDLPLAVYARHKRLLNSDASFVEAVVDTAGIIVDKFSSRNICHFLFDYMTRLELFRLAGADTRNMPIVTEELNLPFMREIANAFGADNIIAVEQRMILKVDRLFVSDNTKKTFQHPGQFAAPWVVASVRMAFNARGADSDRADLKLYISRADASKRRIRNDDEVQSVLVLAGFLIITIGNMSFKEQTELFRQATHIVSPHGAALSNIVFCPPGTKVLEIFHPVGNNPTYAVIAAGAQLQYSALTGHDADNDALLWNDASLPEEDRTVLGGRGALNDRDIVVPIDLLKDWLIEALPIPIY